MKFINIIRALFLQKDISGHTCLKQLDQHSYRHQIHNPDNFYSFAKRWASSKEFDFQEKICWKIASIKCQFTLFL